MKIVPKLLAVTAALMLATSSYGQTRHDERPHGAPKKSAEAQKQPVGIAGPAIELKGGEKIVIEKDGTMAHYDAAGKRVKMRDGKVMEAKDGSKLVMKNNAIWKQITEKGTLRPVQ
jgi:hypothetical protein